MLRQNDVEVAAPCRVRSARRGKSLPVVDQLGRDAPVGGVQVLQTRMGNGIGLQAPILTPVSTRQAWALSIAPHPARAC